MWIKETNNYEIIIRTVIDETVIELPPGVIEPDASNCDTNMTFKDSIVPLPDGTMAQKRLVKIVVKLKDLSEGLAIESEQPTGKIVEGPIELRTKTYKDEKRADDGSLIRRKVTTTRHVKPFFEIKPIDGREVKTFLREEIIATDIEENALHLPPGVKDVLSDNVETECTVENFEERQPDGGLVRRKIVKTVARIAQGPTDAKDKSSKKVMPGNIQSRQTYKEEERKTESGGIRKEKTSTTVYFIPVTEVVLDEGLAPNSQTHEEIINTDILECILDLPCGAIEPFAKNCDTSIRMENFEYTLPDGTPASKKQVIITVHLLYVPDKSSVEVGTDAQTPAITSKLVER